MGLGTYVWGRRILSAAASLMLAALVATPVAAQVKPGDVITSANATTVSNLVSPGVYVRVQKGMRMDIVPTQRVD